MYFWRAILASVLSLICTVSVSAFVILTTLQTTLLDRQEIKGWLQQSGVYNTALPNVTNASPTIQEQVNTSPAAYQNTFKTALDQTFPPSYVQQSTEKVINGAYDWLEGRQPTITFSIDTTTQKDAFVNNTTLLLEQQLANSPRCSSVFQLNSQDPTCLPTGITAKQAAHSLAIDASNNISIFQRPLTNQTLAEALHQKNTPDNSPLTSNSATAQQIPNVVANLRMWLVLLPIIAVVSGGLMILLSTHKFKTAKHLAGRLTLGLVLAFVLGLLIANVGQTSKLSSYVSGANNTTISNIVEPVLHQAAPAIGNRLALIGGIAAAFTGGTWVALGIAYKRRQQKSLRLERPVAPFPPADSISHDPPANKQ